MKKLIAALLALALCLTACGDPPAVVEDVGSVYYLNSIPEADAALQAQARRYTEKTGTAVKIVTVEPGSYAAALTAEMAKSEAPTIFHIGGMSDLTGWDSRALDLTGSAVAGELITDDLNLYSPSGALKAIGIRYEAFGLIVNEALLAQAGHTLDEITGFDTLKAVADDIHARAEELGFDAFSSPGLKAASRRFSGQLANLPLYYEFRDGGITDTPAAITGDYLDGLRRVWDLYITDTAADPGGLSAVTDDMSRAEFTGGQAVFYQGGSWEYAALRETMDLITMIPLYCGVPGEENAGLCADAGEYWAVSAAASEACQKASLDFLHWLVTDGEAAQALVDALGAIPYRAAPPSANAFLATGGEMLAQGRYAVTWAFRRTPNPDAWRATIVTALTAYAADPTDAIWNAVADAFVDGWAYEYKMAGRGN